MALQPQRLLPGVARKHIFLRSLAAVRREFLTWRGQKYGQSADPLFLRLVFATLANSVELREQPLGYEYLTHWISEGHQSGRLTPSDLVKALEVYFKVGEIRYSVKRHLAKSIRIPEDRSRVELAEWMAFAISPKDPDAIDPITGDRLHDAGYREVLTRSHRVLVEASVKEFSAHPLAKVIAHLNRRTFPETVLDRFEPRIHEVQAEELRAMAACSTDEGRIEVARQYRILLRRLREVWAKVSYGTIWTPQPYNSCRIYAAGEWFSTLRVEDRAALLRMEDGYYELDLQNAHFAIMAMLISGAEMKSLLKRGKIWPPLLEWIGYSATEKPLLKTCVYSMLYGGGREMQLALLNPDPVLRKKMLDDKYDVARAKRRGEFVLPWQSELNAKIRMFTPEEVEAAHAKLIQHPAIAELLVGRAALIERIQTDRKVLNAFGKPSRGENAETKLAEVCFSYEKKLLMPVYREAFNTKDFDVCLDQHDGLTIWLRDRTRATEVLDRLKKLVRAAAERCQIDTNLDLK